MGMANKLKSRIRFFLSVLILSISVTASGSGALADKSKSATELDKATKNLVSAANQYKASVEALIPIYENELKAATETLEKRKQLFAQGIISKRDLEAGEQAVKEAQAQLDRTREQITESDHLIAEAKAEAEMAKKPVLSLSAKAGRYTTASAIMRSGGSGGWTLAQAAKVQNFFSANFGRALPISAFGQTATHDRMRFNHRNSMDVAVHPDSAEGKALISYLRSNGIPFIAFRSAVAGAATGAHIHIGYPSHRI
jgi:hypothetical protein